MHKLFTALLMFVVCAGVAVIRVLFPKQGEGEYLTFILTCSLAWWAFVLGMCLGCEADKLDRKTAAKQGKK